MRMPASLTMRLVPCRPWDARSWLQQTGRWILKIYAGQPSKELSEGQPRVQELLRVRSKWLAAPSSRRRWTILSCLDTGGPTLKQGIHSASSCRN